MVSAAHPYLDKDRRKIQGLFDSIAGDYDFLNHLLSLGIDIRWRKRAVAALGIRPSGTYLDACCGTGDLGFSILSDHRDLDGVEVIGSDFSLGMLEHGERKRRRAIEKSRREHDPDPVRTPRFLAGDTLHLPFADKSFDGAAVAFGIRNVQDLAGGLRELHRVVRPGGRVVLLEFTQLKVPVVGPCFHFYLEHILPRIGNFISRSEDRAYTYLNDSIRRWPDGETLAETMREADLEAIDWTTLFPWNVALHVGTRG